MANMNPVTTDTGQESTECVDVDEADDQRQQDGKTTGDQHLAERGLGRDVDTATAVGLHARLALTEAWDLGELTPDFDDHRLRRTTDRRHRQGREDERCHRAEEQADGDGSIVDVGGSRRCPLSG